MLFVKPSLNLRAMVVEVLAAQIGQCMSLPCPTPYIVTVNPRHVGRASGAKFVAFGSEQKGRNLARPIFDTDMLVQMLETQKLTDQLVCFDELIANDVRSPRDLVFDPEHGLSIIDHEGAMNAMTKSADQVTNWLATQVLARMSADQRVSFLRKLRARAAAAHKLDLGMPPSVLQFHQDGLGKV